MPRINSCLTDVSDNMWEHILECDVQVIKPPSRNGQNGREKAHNNIFDLELLSSVAL